MCVCTQEICHIRITKPCRKQNGAVSKGTNKRKTYVEL